MAFYILDEDKTVKAVDFATYFWWLGKEINTVIKSSKSPFMTLETVFLTKAIREANELPKLFETALYAGTQHILNQYSTYEEAVCGHILFCNLFLGPIKTYVVEE
jgi:hypothetical protein